jgi:ribosomal protein S8
MRPSSQACLTRILAQLQLSYQRHQLTVLLRASQEGRSLTALLTRLQRWGVIAHFEPLGGSTLAQKQERLRFRVFLRYASARPAVRIQSFVSRQAQTHVLPLAALVQIARDHRGVQLVLATSRGQLSLEECLRCRCGGTLLLSVYPG